MDRPRKFECCGVSTGWFGWSLDKRAIFSACVVAETRFGKSAPTIELLCGSRAAIGDIWLRLRLDDWRAGSSCGRVLVFSLDFLVRLGCETWLQSVYCLLS